MELPAQFRDLPPWATALGALLAALVVLTGLSMVLGVVFAGIAVGVELGSPLLGALAALVGLSIVVVPAVAIYLAYSGGDAEGDRDEDTRAEDPVDALRERYVAGEIDEETFERRMDELLAGADDPAAPESGPDATVRETALDRERER